MNASRPGKKLNDKSSENFHNARERTAKMSFDYFFNLFIFNGDFNALNKDSYLRLNNQGEMMTIEF